MKGLDSADIDALYNTRIAKNCDCAIGVDAFNGVGARCSGFHFCSGITEEKDFVTRLVVVRVAAEISTAIVIVNNSLTAFSD